MSSLFPDRCDQARELALRFLYSRTNYERFLTPPYTAKALKLARMRELLARIGNPQDAFPVIHIAGTKGKGSVAAMVGSVLQASGCRVGVFTSPHLERVEERLAVDGAPCSTQDFILLLHELMPTIEAMDAQAIAEEGAEFGPTYFEILTAMALLHFARRNVDYAVLEVGLGGRLDSTNVCQPRVTAITSISLDHTQQLGDTLERIAWEKAGIIKPGVPLVSGVTEPGPRDVIEGVCRGQGSRLIQRGSDFHGRYRPPRAEQESDHRGSLDFVYIKDDMEIAFSDVQLNLLGEHQAANATVALAALSELQSHGFELREEAVRAGLRQVYTPARIELVGRRPTILLDAAHNVASIRALLSSIDDSFRPARRIMIFGTTRGKDYRGMFNEIAGEVDHVILTQYAENPRAVPVGELATVARHMLPGRFSLTHCANEAWESARARVREDDLLCIAGSFFLAAELRSAMRRHPLGIPVPRITSGVTASND